ncbi:hypothetical protein BASA81_008021 [Batrachochytrium salamandrivorans]|nr:hypothetical protein BASA81_008021 [Batrachochytrium salamandrivorans]
MFAGGFGQQQPQSFGQQPNRSFGTPSQQQQQQPAFGAPQQSAFGSSFSSPAAPQGQGFGGFGAPGASSGFNAPAAGSGFGNNNSGFGTQQTTAFGAPQQQTGFGAPQQTGFGAPQQTGFGAPQQQTGFGTSQGGFGAPAAAGFGNNNSGFGTQQTGFGAPQQQTGFGAPQQTGFGAPQQQTGFGAPQQTGFGAPQGGFGAPQQQTGFGTSGFGVSQQQQSGFGAPGFSANSLQPRPILLFGQDNYLCIGVQKEFQEKSLEELRMEEYQRTGKLPGGGGMWNQPASMPAAGGGGGLWGASAATPAATTNAWGTTPAPTNTWGAPAAAPTTPTAPAWGTQPQAQNAWGTQPAAPTSGSGLFGGGNTSGSAWGAAPNNATPSAGGGLFGGGGNSLFGNNAPAPTATTSFGGTSGGGGLFGGGGGSMFGATTPTAAPAWGAQASTTPFGSGGGNGGLFGNSTPNAPSGGGLFGNNTSFSTQPQSNGGGLFGNNTSFSTQSQQSGGSGLFGNNPSFSTQPQVQQQQSGLFGSSSNAFNQSTLQQPQFGQQPPSNAESQWYNSERLQFENSEAAKAWPPVNKTESNDTVLPAVSTPTRVTLAVSKPTFKLKPSTAKKTPSNNHHSSNGELSLVSSPPPQPKLEIQFAPPAFDLLSDETVKLGRLAQPKKKENKITQLFELVPAPSPASAALARTAPKALEKDLPKVLRGYTISPSLEDLADMRPEQLARVRNFTVSKPGVGSVLWEGEVDVRRCVIGRDVVIDAEGIEVYGSDKNSKVEIGTKLNRAATCTFVFEASTPEEADSKYLESMLASMSRAAHFKSYENNQLVFTVDHFAYDDDDQEEE